MSFENKHQTFHKPIQKMNGKSIISFLFGFVNNLKNFERNGILMFTKEIITKIDSNNTKALELVHLLITALENGIDGIDIVTNLEIVRDILRNNSVVFDV